MDWELGISEFGWNSKLDRSCSSHDRALALNLSQEEWEGSRLGRATPEYIKDILAEQRQKKHATFFVRN